jgi:hypothetical protein
MKTLVRLFFVLVIVVLIACEKQNSDTTHLSLGIKAINGTSELYTLKKATAAEGLEIDSAVIALERIELKLAGTSIEDGLDNEGIEEMEEPDDYLFAGPYFIDLLAKESEPELPVVDITPGIYTKFEAELYVPEDLGYCIYISGTYSPEEGEGQEFIYTYSQTEDFKAENPDGFEITEDMINNVWLTVDISRLFEGVDFSQAITGEDNIIRIHKGSNNDLADIIESNLETASEIDIE